MDTASTDRSCIELELRSGSRKRLSVEEYEEAQDQATRLTVWATLISYGVEWALASPPVERLTEEWQAAGLTKSRIFDREAYELQMRKLLGIL